MALRLLTGRAMILGIAVVKAGIVLAAEPGFSPTEIQIGVLGSLTGPAAIFGTSNLTGATLAFEEANAAGGVHGRKLSIISEDDETSPPKAIAALRKLTDQNRVFAI